MSGNQSSSHRLCSQPLKNKITKNKVITTRDLCPFEPTRMLTKFHHSYSQPSSSSSPPRPCRIKNTLHSAATCVCSGLDMQPKKGKENLVQAKEESRSHGWNSNQMSNQIWEWAIVCWSHSHNQNVSGGDALTVTMRRHHVPEAFFGYHTSKWKQPTSSSPCGDKTWLYLL